MWYNLWYNRTSKIFLLSDRSCQYIDSHKLLSIIISDTRGYGPVGAGRKWNPGHRGGNVEQQMSKKKEVVPSSLLPLSMESLKLKKTEKDISKDSGNNSGNNSYGENKIIDLIITRCSS